VHTTEDRVTLELSAHCLVTLSTAAL